MKVILIIFILAYSYSFSQFGSFGSGSAYSMNISGAGTAQKLGIYSMGFNPAGIRNEKDSSLIEFNIIFPNFGAQFSNSAFEGADIEKYFNSVNGKSRILTEQDENDIINLAADGIESFMDVNVNLFRFGINLNEKIGSFAISVDEIISVNTLIPSQLIELAFRGNTIGKEYIFTDMTLQASWLRTYSLSWARNFFKSEEGMIKSLNAGLNMKFIQGYAYSEFEIEKGRLFTDNNSKLFLEFSGTNFTAASDNLELAFVDKDSSQKANRYEYKFKPMEDASGSGFAVDLGAIAELRNGVQIGFSLSNIGSLTFDKNVKSNNASLITVIEEITDQELDSISDGATQTLTNLSELSVDLPTNLRLGVAIPLQKFVPMIGIMNLYLDYAQGFNDNFANSLAPRISFGFDWTPYKYVPTLMAGFGNGRFGDFRMSLGLGYDLGVFDIYFGTGDFISTISAGKSASVGLNIRWRI